MELVSRYCPDISKVMFMFRSDQCRLSRLATLERLNDLEIWGGSFYVDEFCELLEIVGNGLRRLSLVHVEDLNKKAVSVITLWCPNLKSLELHSCEFLDERAEDVDGLGWVFLQVDEVKPVPLLDLRVVKIVSTCSPQYVLHILGTTLCNLK
jgi:hypothetical protein